MNAGDQGRTRWLRTFALAAVVAAGAAVLSALPVLRELQLRLTDTYFLVAPKSQRPSPVVVVLIDDRSLSEYGRWPWSRELLARLTRNLADAGAQVIGLDILMPESQSREADAALSSAMRANKRTVVVDKIGAYPNGPRWVEPIPELATAAAAVGHSLAPLDVDGVCRRFPPRELTTDGPRFALAVEMARYVDERATARFLEAYGVSLTEGSEAISTARPVLVPINFRRDWFQTVSAADVLDGKELGAISGRPVLVGFGPVEISDRLSTPLSDQLPSPGVAVHAQILDTILRGKTIHGVPPWSTALVVFGTAFGVVAVARRWRGWQGIVYVVAIGAGVYASGVIAFLYGSRVLPVGPMMLTVVLGPALAYAEDFVIVEHSLRRQMRELGKWLVSRRDETRGNPAGDLPWKLELLRSLQSELGARYELHEVLLDAMQDPVAIFARNGALLLSNRYFQACGSWSDGLALERFIAELRPDEDAPLKSLNGTMEGEAYLGEEPYSVRVLPLPSTTLSPGGGTMVALRSLRARVERDRARAEALGFITHELRTPIVAIQGFAEVLMRYPDSPGCAQAPETIFREAKRLLALISSYLDVLRLDAGARPLRRERVSVEQSVQQVFEILAPLAAAARMRLLLNSDTAPFVMADGPLLNGAVLNLVSNAIKYGRSGSVISVTCERLRQEVVVSVHNEGEPIGQAELARLFEPYYRTREAQVTKPGWGLGVAFVKRIAEKHGGSVAVSSDVAGTVFHLHLPVEAVAVAGEGTT